MDIKQMLPLLLKSKLGEKEQALLKAAQNPDPAAITSLLSNIYGDSTPRVDVFELFKKIIPAETLGKIIKYFDAQKSRH